MLNKCFIIAGVILIAWGCNNSPGIPEKTEVQEIMTQVCDYELQNIHLADNWQRFIMNSWVPSSFYPGLMAQYRVSGDERYLKMAKLRADALFMAPPTWAKLGRITGEQRYFDFLHTQFFDAVIPIYDEEESLFSRDMRYIDKRTANGKKVFWSRGNVWVVASFPRILKNLDQKDPHRKKYEQLLKEMCMRLIELQGEDGMWRTSLLDPGEFPMKESSGTAFYSFGLAWGINNGILDKDIFLPAVLAAWDGLFSVVNKYGRICYVQPGGSHPVVFPERNTNAYAVGAFLLAGEQMMGLLDKI